MPSVGFYCFIIKACFVFVSFVQCQCLINVCGDAVSAVYGTNTSVSSAIIEQPAALADTTVTESQ